ncbi:hypothetical protein FACS1894139_15790 [Planctomycetales bacterium]|nr:hypothetical protein FACS1894107_13160 [Planctomycetales bacterium]GHT07454.1 hypothetical protein FACS1894139_15790 [Planctomycetales bacterium]GHV23770.1 hypothetical protein AGMMS49959_17980 [Planctomycetales bacterium]
MLCMMKDVLYRDFPSFAVIDERVRTENRARLFVGGVRINQGRYRTQAEDEKYRRESLLRQLP